MAKTDSAVAEEEVLEDEDVETPEEEADETPEEETSEDETDEETVAEFEKRFTQFKGETPEEYLKNIEDAYGHSTTEATRLASQSRDLQSRLDQITALVANDPQLAAKLTGDTTTGQQTAAMLDPRLNYALNKVDEQWEQEFNEFVSDHPELQSDQVLNKELIDTLGVVSATMQQRKGRTPSMAEGLNIAWASMGYGGDTNEDKTRMAVKNSSAQSKAPAGRPTAPSEKLPFTKAQLEFAKRAYPEKSREELVEMLSEHVNS